MKEELNSLAKIMKEIADEYEGNCNEFWNNLSEEDQMKAFYSVVKRIVDGEKLGGSYRYILYDVFGFSPQAYSIGMECGFLNLHNAIDSEKL